MREHIAFSYDELHLTLLHAILGTATDYRGSHSDVAERLGTSPQHYSAVLRAPSLRVYTVAGWLAGSGWVITIRDGVAGFYRSAPRRPSADDIAPHKRHNA